MLGFLTTGKMALRLRVQEHTLRRLANAGLIPHSMAGVYRLFAVVDLPRIRDVLIEAGYLEPEPEVPVVSN